MKKGKGFFSKLMLLLIIVPVVEIAILFQMAEITGWIFTIGVAILTGVTGGYLAKQQGREIVDKIQSELSYGQLPGEALLNGLSVLIGGVLLLTPGVLTDVTGFLLIVPFTRIVFIKLIKNKFNSMLQGANPSYVYVNRNDYE